MPTATFDASRFIVRARRRADLSQRELASELEVSQSAVARMEQNLRMVRVHDLSRILELAGLRLAVLDQNGAEVRPVPSDAVRDNARRRFPAHLDVLPPDQVPKHRLFFPRYDRLPATAWFHHRPMRDELRRATPTSPLPDHP
ncbi:MAG: helix-turn-helix domain-containing protein, partial [Cellulomonadaceae bacterium]